MSNFRRVWIISGIIFGLGITILDPLNYNPKNWSAIVFIGIIVGFLSGLCLGFIAYLLFPANKIPWLPHLLAELLLTLIGSFLGASLFFVIDRIPHGQWDQVGPLPPEKPIKILGLSKYAYFGGATFIESKNGNVFSYECFSELPGNTCKWNAVSQAVNENSTQNVPEGISDYFCPPERKLSYIPPVILFKKVIDSLQIEICESDNEVQGNLIILDDGTVWNWEKHFSASALPFILRAWLILGLVAGSASCLALLRREDKRGSQNNGNV